MHSATTCSNVVGVIHKLTIDEFVNNTCTLTTCCCEIFCEVHNVEITHVTLTPRLNIFHSLYAVEKVMEEYEDWSSKDHAT